MIYVMYVKTDDQCNVRKNRWSVYIKTLTLIPTMYDIIMFNENIDAENVREKYCMYVCTWCAGMAETGRPRNAPVLHVH